MRLPNVITFLKHGRQSVFSNFREFSLLRGWGGAPAYRFKGGQSLLFLIVCCFAVIMFFVEASFCNDQSIVGELRWDESLGYSYAQLMERPVIMKSIELSAASPETGRIQHPKFSPSGRHIAFEIEREETIELWMLDLKTKSKQKVETESSGYFDSNEITGDMDWSPLIINDKEWFVFVHKDRSENVLLLNYIKDGVIGSSHQRLTGIENRFLLSSPQWSSDAEFLIFYSTQSGFGDIFIIPDIKKNLSGAGVNFVETKRLRGQSSDLEPELWPSIIKDDTGNYFAFYSSPGENDNYQIRQLWFSRNKIPKKQKDYLFWGDPLYDAVRPSYIDKHKLAFYRTRRSLSRSTHTTICIFDPDERKLIEIAEKEGVVPNKRRGPLVFEGGMLYTGASKFENNPIVMTDFNGNEIFRYDKTVHNFDIDVYHDVKANCFKLTYTAVKNGKSCLFLAFLNINDRMGISGKP